MFASPRFQGQIVPGSVPHQWVLMPERSRSTLELK